MSDTARQMPSPDILLKACQAISKTHGRLHVDGLSSFDEHSAVVAIVKGLVDPVWLNNDPDEDVAEAYAWGAYKARHGAWWVKR